MFIYIALIFSLCLYNIKICIKEKYFSDYMSIKKTASIKGIFILLVFSRHFASYASLTEPGDDVYKIISRYLGQLIVTMFLFYSGYGVLESIKIKGKKYIDSMVRKRILKVLVNFDIAIFIFWCINTILGERYSVKGVLLALIGWGDVGNSNWYVFCILITYIFTYISFKIFKDKEIVAISIVTIFCLIYIYFMSIYKQNYWYNTILCYPAGMWFSRYRNHIEGFVLKNIFTYLFSLCVCIFVFIFAHDYASGIMIYQVCTIAFALSIVLFTMKIAIDNKVLQWLGNNLFGLFILQRIPMILFKAVGVNSYNTYVYFILCFAGTILLAIPFNKITSRIKL